MILWWLDDGLREAELHDLDGKAILVVWYAPGGVAAVEDVIRLKVERDDRGDERLASIRFHYFCPELLREVGAKLGVAVKTNGYRH